MKVVARSIVVSVVCAPFAFAQASPARDTGAKDPGSKQTGTKDQGVADLIARMETSERKTTALRLTLRFTSRVPAGVDAAPIELVAVMKVRALRVPAADAAAEQRFSRLDVQLDTPQGPLRTEQVRTPDGIWMHQASELTGERWLHVDKVTMERLDRAAEVFGSGDALSPATGRAGSIVGADLLKGLSRSYDLRVGDPDRVAGEPCTTVHATLRRPGNSELDALMPRERPAAILLHFATKDLLLRKMVQSAETGPVATIELREVDTGAELKKSDFRLAPPDGVKFVNVLSDKMASVRIRAELQRLDEWEKRKKAAEPDKR